MNNKLLQQAQQQHQEGNLKDALASYKKVLKEDPADPNALHGAGVALAQMGNHNDALRYLDSAIHQQPANAAFYNSKGNILTRLGRLIPATISYDQAIKLKPRYAAAYNNIGNCFYRQERMDIAEKCYVKAIVLHPDFTDAHYNYGRMLADNKDYNSAVSELKKALAAKPNHYMALGQLGHIYLHQGKYAEAVNCYQKRLALNPNHAQSHHDLGIALLKNKKFKKSAEQFTEALALDPSLAETHYHLATACVQIGDYKTALSHYMQQLEQSPHLESYYNIGVLYMYQEQHRDAVDYFNHAIGLEPAYLDAHLNIAATYLKMGKLQQAIEHYQEAEKIKPNDAEIQHILTALQQKRAPATAPREYVSHLFDQYAAYYDQHLSLHLQYRTPQQLYQVIDEEANTEDPQWRILDLGCGTGLCGEYFKPMAKELIGVDLAKNMLAIARNKKLYNKLKCQSLQDALNDYQDCNLILAADVFTYVGELNAIFAQAHNALVDGGYFAFTVEKTNDKPYVLQQNIRYAHHRGYLEELIKKHGFKTIRFDNATLRTQHKKGVEGYLIVLQK